MIAIVLLAAGASRRMGEPKQLLQYRGESMIRRMARAALDTDARPLVVVLGADASRMETELSGLDYIPIHNPDWQQGMSTSVRVGLEKVQELRPEVEAVLFLVVDQPYVKSSLLRLFITQYKQYRSPLVAAVYGTTPGVPALFDRSLFEALKQLKGDKGARPLFEQYKRVMKTVPFPQGAFDLDTPDDYQRLKEEE